MLVHKHPELQHARYVVFVNASRRYVDCSPAVSELLGYSRDEMMAKRIDDLSYDVSAVPKLFAVYQATSSQQGEYILQHKNRTPVPIRYRAFVLVTDAMPPFGSQSKIGDCRTWPLCWSSILANRRSTLSRRSQPFPGLIAWMRWIKDSATKHSCY